jgi:hypothetical protein
MHIHGLITNALAVQCGIDIRLIKDYFGQIKIVEWAGVQRLGGGDVMHSTSFRQSWLSEDHRDTTCIRVSVN